MLCDTLRRIRRLGSLGKCAADVLKALFEKMDRLNVFDRNTLAVRALLTYTEPLSELVRCHGGGKKKTQIVNALPLNPIPAIREFGVFMSQMSWQPASMLCNLLLLCL